MDSVSMQEIRVFARKLAENSLLTQSQRAEVLQGLEFILQQEEAQMDNSENIEPWSIEKQFSVFDARSTTQEITLVPKDTVRLHGIYIDGEPMLFSRGYEETFCGIVGPVFIGRMRYGNPLEIRGQITEAGQNVSFTLWGNRKDYNRTYTLSLVGVKFKPKVMYKRSR